MSKMKAPLNMGDNISKAEAFMDILGEAAQRKKDNKSRLCFMYDASFDESKRFNRFVTENRNALSNFLIKHFVTYEFDEYEGVMSGNVSRRSDSISRFLGDTVRAYHHMRNNEVYLEKDKFREFVQTAFEYDVSLRTRKYLFSSVWQKEKDYYSSLQLLEKETQEQKDSNTDDTQNTQTQGNDTDVATQKTKLSSEDEVDYDGLVYDVLSLWITHSDNAAYNSFFSNVPAFRDVIDFQIRELSRYRIQSLAYADRSVDETSYYKLCLLKEEDCFDFLLDLLGQVIVESERVLDYVYDMIRNEDSLMQTLYNFKTEFCALHTDYANDMNALNEKLCESKRKLSESETNYKNLESKVNAMCNDVVKPFRKELNDSLRNLEKQEEKYQKLLDKYEVLTEYIEQLEETVRVEDNPEDADDSNISFADFPVDMFTKRIVFVREKQFDHYIIMKRLQSYFPNANFTNGISSEINMKSTDMVVLLTRYVKHGTYWGARDSSKKAGVPYVHCECTNIPLVLKTIADFC